jgi:hypothetical protein
LESAICRELAPARSCSGWLVMTDRSRLSLELGPTPPRGKTAGRRERKKHRERRPHSQGQAQSRRSVGLSFWTARTTLDTFIISALRVESRGTDEARR